MMKRDIAIKPTTLFVALVHFQYVFDN